MEPLTIGLIVAGLLVAYLIGKNVGRKAESEAAELERRIEKEQDPHRKQDLSLLWVRAKGIHRQTRRAYEAAITERTSGVNCFVRGVNARVAGEPLSANPFGSRFWGKGKEWYEGWIWASQNPDQLEKSAQEHRK